MTGVSPAQQMTGRQIHTAVPVQEKSLASWDLVYQKDPAAEEAYRFIYNRKNPVCPLSCICIQRSE